jgi:Na+-transporting NADH:ubiquinone oxidoreductase subunit NqrA
MVDAIPKMKLKVALDTSTKTNAGLRFVVDMGLLERVILMELACFQSNRDLVVNGIVSSKLSLLF